MTYRLSAPSVQGRHWRSWSAVVVILLVAGAGRPAGRDQQAPPQRATQTLSEGVRAVLVDVVVRDRRGQPVRDLAQSEIEILEDGTPQTIGSFTPVFTGAGAPQSASGAAASGAPAVAGPVDAGPLIVALVFDRLSPEARQLAIQASQRYVGAGAEVSEYVGVFGIDLSFATYAPFTKNAKVLRQALSTVAGSASSAFNGFEAQRRAAERESATSAQTEAAATASAGPGTAAAVGSSGAQAQLAQMQAQMLADFDLMERDQQGYATTNGLFAIVGALGRLPGRKSIVLFSEGISIPPAVQRLYKGVIDAANRANVSIYTMDSAGLRAVSEQSQIRDQVNQTAGAGTGVLSSGSSEPMTKQLEENEYVLRQDAHTSLGELAEETGGILFENSNDLRDGFARVEQDLRNYYLLGYTPANEVLDGKFRRIEVRVKRPGVSVSARKGYFAVRDSGGMPVNTWEAPGLGALEKQPIPNAFPVRAAAFLFPEPERPGLVPVVVQLGTAPLTFQPTPDNKSYTSDFSVIVRFLDQSNRVARKVSQHYEIRGTASQLDAAKRGEVIFYREPELDPGVYTMETVVHDAPSNKASVRISTVEVPARMPGKLRVSSLLLVRRAEKVPEKDRRAENPLMVADAVLYPNIGEAISKGAKEVGFFFTAYPAKGGPALQAALDVMDNTGARLAQVPLTLAAPDASGRVQLVGRLPLESFQPGTYEIRVIVQQGGDQISRTAMLRLEP